MSRLLQISAAITLALALSSPVSAEEQQLNFSYDPAELVTVGAAARLYERIVAFAKSECRMISTPPMINPRADRCSQELTDQLVTNINAPLLTAHASGAVNLAAAER